MAIDKSLDIGATGLDVGTKKMEVAGHNIVNLGSLAFKGSTMYQTDAFSETLQQSSASTSGGSNTAAAQIGNGTKFGSIFRDYSQGSLLPSNDPAHLAIEGKGWFQVLNSVNGSKFATRDGSFRVDVNGDFVTQHGHKLQGRINDASVEPTYTVTYVNSELVYTMDTPGAPAAPTIGSLGIAYSLTVGGGLTVDAGVPGSITTAEIEAQAPRVSGFNISDKGELEIQLSNGDAVSRGQILLMNFKDEQGLLAESGGLFSGFSAAGQDTFSIDNSQPGTGPLGAIRQRRLEGSNVDLTSQFTEIISTQKYVQGSARIITAADRTLDTVVNLIR